MNINQEGASNQVKDDAQATETSEGPIPSSSISSNYAAKYINFHNIPLVDTEVVFMFDINVQHEVPRISHLFTIPVLTDLEKDVKELKDVDNSTKFISKIQSKVPKAVKEYLGSSLDDAMHKVIWKNVADIIKEHSVPAETVERLRQQYAPQKKFNQKTTLFETMTKSKSFNKSPKQRALYHALIESILEDEDAMDEGVADKLKKRKQDDADKDEGPFARLDRGLKRQKTSNDIKPSMTAKSTKLPRHVQISAKIY
ncbi:hypothetical protein Tco_1309607 [Tanacetum coccineum]